MSTKFSPAADHLVLDKWSLLTAPEAQFRIAFLVEATSGGVGRHVIDLAVAMRELGHSVDLLYSARRIDSRFSNGLVRLASLGASAYAIDAHHGLHPTDASLLLEVRRYLRENGPFDFLHAHSTKAGFIGRIAAVGLSCQTLYTPHGLITNAPFRSRNYQFMAGKLERGLAILGDAVLCVSEDERASALELKFPQEKLFVVQNGIDLSEAEQYRAHRLTMRRSLSLSEGDICVGFVARMIPGKAPGDLLEAFALAQADFDRPVKLVFVGNGPESTALQKRIEQLQLREKVLLAGELNGLQAMSAFDIFVLPSMSEAFPYVILEALAMGLPVISTRVGGVAALVQEGVNGFVVPKSAPAEMAAALRKLISDVQLRKEMGATSSKLAREFSLERMVRQIENIYSKLLLKTKTLGK